MQSFHFVCRLFFVSSNLVYRQDLCCVKPRWTAIFTQTGSVTFHTGKLFLLQGGNKLLWHHSIYSVGYTDLCESHSCESLSVPVKLRLLSFYMSSLILSPWKHCVLNVWCRNNSWSQHWSTVHWFHLQNMKKSLHH